MLYGSKLDSALQFGFGFSIYSKRNMKNMSISGKRNMEYAYTLKILVYFVTKTSWEA